MEARRLHSPVGVSSNSPASSEPTSQGASFCCDVSAHSLRFSGCLASNAEQKLAQVRSRCPTPPRTRPTLPEALDLLVTARLHPRLLSALQ